MQAMEFLAARVGEAEFARVVAGMYPEVFVGAAPRGTAAIIAAVATFTERAARAPTQPLAPPHGIQRPTNNPAAQRHLRRPTPLPE